MLQKGRRSRSWSTRLAGILMLSALSVLSLTQLAQAQSTPPGFGKDPKTENLAATTSPVPTIYDMVPYEKSRTQFDGVTNENVVTFLRLKATQGLEIPTMSTGQVNTDLDFTVMIWFKISEKAVENDLMYLFSFENSASCFFTNNRGIMCDSTERAKLQITSEDIVPGKWLHLTFSTRATGEAYIQISDNNRVIGYDEVAKFSMKQNVRYGWKICLGDSQAKYGFEGGLRELVVRNTWVSPVNGFKAKNQQFTYANDFKAYFRFAHVGISFDKDEFVDRTWNRLIGEDVKFEELIGTDFIPNDVCPTSFKSKQFVDFDGEQSIQTVTLSKSLPQSKYSYTMSTTLLIDETSCTERNPGRAAQSCNIFKLEEVFMLYFYSPNMAKFHFFAFKNYYESQSRAFFIPHDQWITIQVSFTHYGGYEIVLVDQNGEVIFRRAEDRNMQEMRPLNRFSLLDSFIGRVSHLQICQIETQVPYQQNSMDNTKCLFDLDFSEEGIKGKQILNRGSQGELEFVRRPRMKYTFFELSPLANNGVRGTYEAEGVFDGIACNDLHITTRLNGESSFLRFSTPPLEQWLSENTIEFWFKLNDEISYDENKMLFSMKDTETEDEYFQIFTQGGDIICAPFGTEQVRDPVIVFTDFSFENQDEFGWWHISCGYSFQQTVKGTLTNADISQSVKETLIGFPKFFPQNTLRASFGNPIGEEGLVGHQNFFIKELRYWSQQLDSDHLTTWMYRQIDPTILPEGMLLSYLRLNSGSFTVQNFAEANEFYNFTETNITMSKFSLVEEFSEKDEYYYDVKIGEVVARKVITHHNVCPLYTYYKDTQCYSEPVNDLRLTVYPQWNSGSNTLDWTFSILDSSMIDSRISLSLTDDFQANDAVLQKALSASDSKFYKTISSQYFRQESEYQISATVSSIQKTFIEETSINFVPSQCRWFTLLGSNADGAFKEFTVSPGRADIKFNLQLKKNPYLDCGNFTFYDEFYTIDFDFITTDTVDYIDPKPELAYNIYKPSDFLDLQFIDVLTQDPFNGDLYINVTIPKDEQYKFPVFTDVSILMTIRWTNSEFQQEIESDDLVFQNAMYTMKFSPLDNELFVSLEVASTELTRDETAILDGQGSYITNLPASLRQQGLKWSWTCPDSIAQICDNQTSSVLSIPWKKIVEANVTFEYQYTIEMVVTWLRQDGTAQAERRSETFAWYDMVKPDFEVTFSPVPVLVTSNSNTAFKIISNNFDVKTDYRNYKIDWIIEPELNNTRGKAVLSGGAIMQVIRGNFEPNTLYTITTVVTYKALPKLTSTQQVQFATKAPPTQGTVLVQPSRGYIGTPFTLVLRGWESDNPPIVYDVFQTYNTAGTRKGRIINKDGPLPIGKLYQYVAKNVNPVIVEVYDDSAEKVSFIMAPSISLEAPPDLDGNTNSTNTTNSTDNEQLEGTPLADIIEAEDPLVEDPLVEDPLVDVDPIVEEKVDPIVEDVEALVDEVLVNTNTTNLLAKILHTGDDQVSKKVSYMARVASTFQKEPYNKQDEELEFDNSEQVAVRMEILREIQRDADLYSSANFNADMSEQQFLYETMPILRDLLSVVEFYNDEVAEEAAKVIDAISYLKEGVFVPSIQLVDTFRISYLQTLENLNKYTRLRDSKLIRSYVLERTLAVEDAMCASENLSEKFHYEGLGEISFAVRAFDQSVALKNEDEILSVNDVTYKLQPNEMYSSFGVLPGDLCAQVTSVKGLADDSKDLYSQSVMQVTVYQLESEVRHPLQEVLDHTVATFEVNPVTYRNGQTVCMAYSETAQSWDADLCLSTVNAETYSLECSCNSFTGSFVGVFTDTLRLFDTAAVFPTVEILEESTAPVAVDMPVSGNTDIKGTSYVILAVATILAFFGLAGSPLVMKIDHRDWNDLVKAGDSTGYSDTDRFVSEVAKVLNEPKQVTSYRTSALMSYRSLFSGSLFATCLLSIHPLVSPFTNFEATRSRLLRFNAYLLQVIVYAVGCSVYFGNNYRATDELRNDEVLDQTDVSNIMFAACLGAVVLLPFVSEPLSHLLSNKIQVLKSEETQETTATIVNRRILARYSFIVLVCLFNVGQLVYAIMQSTQIHGSNQYCMATSFFFGLFLATFVSNLMRVAFNSCLAKKATPALLLSSVATEAARDMDAVKAVRKLMSEDEVSSNQFLTNQHMRKDSEHATKVMLDEKNNISPSQVDSARQVVSLQAKEEVRRQINMSPATDSEVKAQSQSARENNPRFLHDLVRRSADKVARGTRYSSIIEADNASSLEKSSVAN